MSEFQVTNDKGVPLLISLPDGFIGEDRRLRWIRKRIFAIRPNFGERYANHPGVPEAIDRGRFDSHHVSYHDRPDDF